MPKKKTPRVSVCQVLLAVSVGVRGNEDSAGAVIVNQRCCLSAADGRHVKIDKRQCPVS